MQRAFVLIKSETSPSGNDLLDRLKAVEGVKEAHYVYGLFDVIVKVEANSDRELHRIITRGIRRLRHVQSTITTIVVA